MFCARCGEKLPDQAAFCPKCGARQQTAGAEPSTIDNRMPLGSGDQHCWESSQQVSHDCKRASAPVHARATSRRSGARHRVGRVAVVVAIVAAAACICIAALFLFSRPSSITIDEATFLDAGVRASVVAADTNGDGVISPEEAEAFTDFSITDAVQVSGLGTLFPNLARVAIQSSGLTSVDLSDVKRLESIMCPGSALLTTVVLPKTSTLSRIDISNTGVTSIDLSGLDGLASFVAMGASNLGSVDVSGCPNLEQVEVDDAVQVDGIEHAGLRTVWAPMRLAANDGSAVEVARDEQGRPISIAITEDGGLTESYAYGDDGRLASVTTGDTPFACRYNDQGLLTALAAPYDPETQYWHDAQGVNESNLGPGSTEYLYDEQGRYQTFRAIEGGDMPWRYYDDAGRLASYGYGTTSTTYANWEYGSDGRLARYIYGTSGDLTQLDVTYDDAGRMVGSDISENGHLSGAHAEDVTLFDASGGFSFWRSSYTLDDAGRIVGGRATNRSGEFRAEATLTYDEAGNLVEAARSDDTGTTTFSLTWKRFIIAQDAADPEALIGIEPTYSTDLVAGYYYRLPSFVPDGLPFAAYRDMDCYELAPAE